MCDKRPCTARIIVTVFVTAVRAQRKALSHYVHSRPHCSGKTKLLLDTHTYIFHSSVCGRKEQTQDAMFDIRQWLTYMYSSVMCTYSPMYGQARNKHMQIYTRKGRQEVREGGREDGREGGKRGGRK